MEIKALVEEGKLLEKQCSNSNGVSTLSGVDYSKWISKSILFLEENYPSSEITKRFKDKSKNAVGNFKSCYEELLGIIESIPEYEEK